KKPSKKSFERRRRRAGSSLLSHGEPMVWLTGGALATSLFMIIGLLVLVLGCILASFFISIQASTDLLRWVAMLAVTNILFAIAYFYWVKKMRNARYLVLAWGAFLVPMMCYITMTLGWLPNNFWTANSILFGFMFLVILFSFGLADRINNLRAEQMAAQTRALQEAQDRQKIAEENLNLQGENMRMSAELDVTRQLQEMVLPTSAELSQIKHLDIACWMEPADEVGGDYYDVLQYHDKVIIGVGDVTGHGLASGVLMLMVQTAIRTLAISNINSSNEFFRILNQTLYDNIERMGIDKNLTLIVLDYQEQRLRISGQHEEVLLIRKDGAVERIDTFDLGFIIGVERDINALINEQEIALQPGDGLFLYTDGITEAFNNAQQQYGLDRLCEVIEKNWAKSPKDIQQAVLHDFRQYIGERPIMDDFTFMVIKQLAA
ncbi:MAG: SpoIIE family protein phosphatase, partial [Pseudomonadota bacterium]